ncbi:MAG TPA: S8 family serine peptidase [Steroidobacteraceae bacterium]
MSSRRLGLATVALLTMVAASATAPPRLAMRQPARAGSAPLLVFGGRSPQQLARGIGGKLDATLADIARHAGRARPDHALEDLRSLSPAAHFKQSNAGAGPLVAVDAVTRGDPQRLKQALISLGLEHPAVFRNDVGGWLPVSAIETAVARGEAVSLRAALWHTRALVATQGDFAQGTSTVRAGYPALDGSGVTVGILSDSYNCYAAYAANNVPTTTPNGTGYAENGFTADEAADIATGALPANINVLEEVGGTFGQSGTQDCMNYSVLPVPQLPYADEGRAMLQIVHAVAPGASLAFYSAANSEADFANGIQALANAGAKVIADDVGYYDEPFFQDGLLAEAVDTVEAQGVAYFSAAGNNSNLAYDNVRPKFTAGTNSPQQGEMLFNFDPSGSTQTPFLAINVPPLAPGEFIAAVVQWDDPYLTGAYPGNSGSTFGANSQIDLCVQSNVSYSVTNLDGDSVICTGPNAVGADPVQILVIGNPTNAAGNTAAGTIQLEIGLANKIAPSRIKVAWEDNGAGSTIQNFVQPGAATIQGHPGAAGAAAVGAAFFANAPPCGLPGEYLVIEPYSSFGDTTILYDTAGHRLTDPIVRQKPDFIGPDGTSTTFFGFALPSTPPITDNSVVVECSNNDGFPKFFGTSAATAHAAGLATLMMQADATLSPTQIYTAMQRSATLMESSAPDSENGYGFIQAGAALAWPEINVSPTAIRVGQSATVTWKAINLNTCLSVALSTSATSGTINVSPASVTQYTYDMSCSNAAGSAKNSAKLEVGPALPASQSGGHGGGGALGAVTLIVLAHLLLAKAIFSSALADTKCFTASRPRTAMGPVDSVGNAGDV